MAERLTEWAERKRIHPKTAYRMYVENRMPVPTERLSERVILVHDPDFIDGKEKVEGKTVIYARVSSTDQKNDLDSQVLRILESTIKKGIHIDEIVKEIGSGLNDNRAKLNRILADRTVVNIVVEHQERLTRYGFNMLKNTLKAQNREIIVIDNNEIEDDVVRDVTEVLTSLCTRIYGKKSAKNRAEKALKAMDVETE